MRGSLAVVILCGLLRAGGCLECLECSGLPYNCTGRVRECYVQQKVCISTAYTYQDENGFTDLLVKGCSQGLSCNESAYVNTGTKAVYISNTCCMSNQCNQGTYYARAIMSYMSCKSCLGDSNSCSSPNLPTMQCSGAQNLCMSMKTVTLSNVDGTQSEVVAIGCGTGPLCGRKIDYGTINGSVFSQVDCCGSKECNTAIPTVIPNITHNGLQCYSCNETGKKECNVTRITKVGCTGHMNRCVDVVGFSKGNTLMRGCCSEDACLGLTTSFSLPSSQKLYCCTGNLCNNGQVTSYVSSLSGPGRSLTESGYSLPCILLFAAALHWAIGRSQK